MRMMLIGWLLSLLPKNLLSYWVGRLVSWRPPRFLRGLLLRWFAGRYHINLDEAERPIDEYDSIQALFTRKLKSGARPISAGGPVHPADGRLTEGGEIRAGQLIQVKGWTYGVGEFLGEPQADEEFNQGTFMTYYLCPTDYHRVHSPVDGKLFKVRHIPGTLWPVNEWSVTHVPRLFAINERVVMWIESAYGPVAVVMVGATNVGQIQLTFDPEIVTNQPDHSAVRSKIYDPALLISHGEELGVFKMGSTVVVIYPKNFPTGLKSTGFAVKMGQAVED